MLNSRLLVFIFLISLLPGKSFAKTEVVNADLYIKDHKFSPEVLILPEGKKLIITVYNQDKTIEEFESFDLKREKIVLGKSKIRIILAPLKIGEYGFFGDFHAETAQGKLIIVSEEDYNKKLEQDSNLEDQEVKNNNLGLSKDEEEKNRTKE